MEKYGEYETVNRASDGEEGWEDEVADARRRYRDARRMDYVKGRTPTLDEIRARRRKALKEAMDEPGFNQELFDIEFPPIPESSDEVSIERFNFMQALLWTCLYHWI